MADLSGINMDKDVKESGQDFEQLPTGNYNAVIVGDELSQNSKGTGMLLTFTWQIIDDKENGKYKGRNIDSRHNIQHTSEVTQRIGQGELKRICGLCGVQYPPQNTEALFGRPISLYIKENNYKSNKLNDDGSERIIKGNQVSAFNNVPEIPQTNPVNGNMSNVNQGQAANNNSQSGGGSW